MTKSQADSLRRAQEIDKQAAREAAKIAQSQKKEKLKIEEGLRSEYFKASKDTSTSLRGFRSVESAANTKNPTGATDVALVFGFMKTQDPDSVVREGEFATAENTGGVDDKVRVTYNKLLNGDRLTPEQRQNFLQAARESLKGRMELQLMTDNRFSELAKRAEADAEDVINPIFQTEFRRIFGENKSLAEDNPQGPLEQSLFPPEPTQPQPSRAGYGTALGSGLQKSSGFDPDAYLSE